VFTPGCVGFTHEKRRNAHSRPATSAFGDLVRSPKDSRACVGDFNIQQAKYAADNPEQR
jgi:hypothetical protein